MAQYDLTKIKRNPAGMVQTGEYSFVNPDYLSQSGYQQAINYASQQSPTVLTDANIRERVIPDLNQQATNLYGTPSPYQPPTGKTTTTKTATDKQTNGLYDELKGILPDTGISEPVDPLAEEYAKFQEDIFKQMEQEVSEQAQKQTQRVADMYSSRYRDLAIQQKQAVAQKAQLGGYLFSSGVSRYGSVSGGGLVTSTERALTNQLNDLRMDEAEAIDKVREAQKEGNWRVMQARLNYAENVRAEKEKRQDELNKEIKKQNEAVLERRQEIEKGLAVAEVMNYSTNLREMLSALNQMGFDITPDELAKTVKNLTGNEELTDEEVAAKLNGIEKNYYLLKQLGGLPPEVLSQPEEQQLGAYLKWHRDQSLKPVTAPKEPVGPTFSLAETKKYGLPPSLIGESEKAIMMSLQNPEPVPWFREKAYMDARMTLRPEILQQMWDDFREKILSGQENDFTDQEQRKLEQAGLSDASRDEQLDYLYGITGRKPPASIIGQVKALKQAEATPEEIEEFITVSGYDPNHPDFE